MKKKLCTLLAALLCALLIAGCAGPADEAGQSPQDNQTAAPAASDTAAKQEATPEPAAAAPKYVFLFIGDGMSYPQIQSASYYLGAQAHDGAEINEGGLPLAFTDFPVAGSATTYDSTSFCPDSASTATSIATGHKTHSGVINMDETATDSFTTIAEQLKEQKGFQIGIVSSVNLNHATPAAFYAHQPSRGLYYEIGQELIASGFDYFAGGGLLQPTGKEEDKESLYELAEQAGYTVAMTRSEAEAVSAADQKALIIEEQLADGDALPYELDREESSWSLADYVNKGIEVLNDGDNGFFMMVEGGKIDWACHANDAGATIGDTLAFSEAVGQAVAFAKQHPEETLILVTGDHETGGLTIGFAGTDYDTYLTNLANQKISYAKFDSDYVSGYKENKTSFADVMQDVETLFGLKTTGDAEDKLVLTDYETQLLQEAYNQSMDAGREVSPENQKEYVLYGSYEPLTVTITHILNNKSGISFSSYAHTGLPVAVFAQGAGQEAFDGYYDNTQIYHSLKELLRVN